MARKLTFEARTDVGRERSENQDHFGAARLETVEFFIVCDGMGGHAGGSTASRLGVQTIEDALLEGEGDTAARIEDAVIKANAAIHDMSLERRELRGMGTTVVILGIDHEQDCAHVAHVGDSRIYRLRGNVFQRLTRDHTMVQRLVDEGIITEEEAEHHPNSNVISRSLGGHPDVDVEHGPDTYALEDGDVFLLCTDGLSGLVSEHEMAELLATMPPIEAAELLIHMANENGGHDNITVEIILVGEQKERPDEDFVFIHPPKGPTSRELREQELGLHTPYVPEVFDDPPPIELPDEHPTEYGLHPGAPVVEEQGTGKLLVLLGVLTLLLFGLVVVLMLRLVRVPDPAPVDVVPAAEQVVPAMDEPILDFDSLEDPIPQPVYEVPPSEHEDALRQ